MSPETQVSPMGPLVMLPGACSTSWIFNDFRSYFEAAGWNVLTPELRHHDQVPGLPADPALSGTSLADYVDDLSRMIEGLARPPILLGHSMGGLLAQLLAAKGLARGAILLTPAKSPPPWV